MIPLRNAIGRLVQCPCGNRHVCGMARVLDMRRTRTTEAGQRVVEIGVQCQRSIGPRFWPHSKLVEVLG